MSLSLTSGCFRTVIASLLLILLDQVTGAEHNDFPTSNCRNFSLDVIKNIYLPSEIINISASCSVTTFNKTEDCPSWSVFPQQARIKILRNETRFVGNSCVANMSIQVVYFPTDNMRTQLLIDFINPRSEGAFIINVEKSDDGGICHHEQDCYYYSQICSKDWGCQCPFANVLVKNLGMCFPVVSRFYGQCTYSEQCRATNSICKNSLCQCLDHHMNDEYFFNCVPEARGFAESCSTDENCQKRDINTWCTNGYCSCKSDYFNMYGYCRNEKFSLSGSPRTYCGWTEILAVVSIFLSAIRI